MAAVLFCKTGLFSGTSFKIENEATVGKSDTNKIVLRSDIVSSNHAKITFDDAQKSYFLEDLGSSNGTLLDGIRVTGKERLERLHVITFAGKFDFIFQVGGVIPAKTATPVPEALIKDKTMIEKAEDILPAAFGKKEAPKEDKTMFDISKEAPAPLPSFGKAKDAHQTMFDKGADAPAPLPSFGKPKDVAEPKFESKKEVPPVTPNLSKPKDEEQTISSKAMEPALPSFQKKPEVKPPENIERTEVMRQTPTPAPVSKPRFSLVVGKLNKNFDLKDGATTIGRTIGCDIIIDDVSLSRRHAVVTVIGDKITIRDLGSSNGTSVEKKRIGAEIEITSSSDIRLGMVEVRIKKIV